MLGLCAIWGGNIAVIKISNEGIPPLFALSFRGVFASVCLGAYLLALGRPLFHRDRRLVHGINLAVLFGVDFLFTYWGTAYTDASRAVIFLYTQPLWTAIGAHLLLKDDRLTGAKAFGLLVAFSGMAWVFLARPSGGSGGYWVGDLMEIGAALAWSATTLYLKMALRDRSLSEVSTLFYQTLFSLPLLFTMAVIVERGAVFTLSPGVAAAFAFQTVVPTASYLVWFGMIHRYPVSQLAAFTLLAPPFGVLAGAVLVEESVGWSLVGGLGLVSLGIFLVTRPIEYRRIRG